MRTFRFYILLLLAATLPGHIAAQEQLSKAFDKFVNDCNTADNITSVSTYEFNDHWNQTPGYCRGYDFHIPAEKPDLTALLKAFHADMMKAYQAHNYKAYEKMQRDPIGYGETLEKTVTFGTRENRNYRVYYFRDAKDKNFRTCYALSWGEEDDGSIRGSAWKVYSRDPQKVTDEMRAESVSPNVDINYDDIKTSIDVLQAFGNLHTAYRDQDSPTSLSFKTGIVNRTAQLLKKKGNLLGSDEKEIIRTGLSDMISYTFDQYLRGMLNTLSKSLK
jgi:hypothetical protein